MIVKNDRKVIRMKDIYVVGAILIKDQRILCAQRGGAKSLAYLWEFPGGKIEAGETAQGALRSEEHTSELQSRFDLVCRLLLEKKKQTVISNEIYSNYET